MVASYKDSWNLSAIRPVYVHAVLVLSKTKIWILSGVTTKHFRKQLKTKHFRKQCSLCNLSMAYIPVAWFCIRLWSKKVKVCILQKLMRQKCKSVFLVLAARRLLALKKSLGEFESQASSISISFKLLFVFNSFIEYSITKDYIFLAIVNCIRACNGELSQKVHIAKLYLKNCLTLLLHINLFNKLFYVTSWSRYPRRGVGTVDAAGNILNKSGR